MHSQRSRKRRIGITKGTRLGNLQPQWPRANLVVLARAVESAVQGAMEDHSQPAEAPRAALAFRRRRSRTRRFFTVGQAQRHGAAPARRRPRQNDQRQRTHQQPRTILSTEHKTQAASNVCDSGNGCAMAITSALTQRELLPGSPWSPHTHLAARPPATCPSHQRHAGP